MKFRNLLKNGWVLLSLTIFTFCLTAGAVLSNIKDNSFVSVQKQLEAVISATTIDQPEQFTYNNIDDSTVEITGFNESVPLSEMLDVTFPTTYEGKQVVGIADNAFKATVTIEGRTDYGDENYSEEIIKNNIKKITIPNSIKNIGNKAFFMQTNLSEVVFAPDSQLETIGESAFSGGEYYTTYSDERNSVNRSTNYEQSFASNQITNIKIPKSVKSIGNQAFYMCENLATLTFEPNSSLQTIGEYAFASGDYVKEYSYSKNNYEDREDSSLKESSYTFIANKISEIEIPKSVTSIGSHAFYMCENLTTLTFEADSSLQTIGAYAFAGGIFTSSSTEERDKESGDSSVSTLKSNKIQSIQIPKSVNIIEESAFDSCVNLVTLTFEKNSSLQTIEKRAFSGGKVYASNYDHPKGEDASITRTQSHNSLSTVEIPASVESIGEQAFYFCGELATLSFEEGSVLQTIGENAFNGESWENDGDSYSLYPKITYVELPNSVINLNQNSFKSDVVIITDKNRYAVLKEFSNNSGLTYKIDITFKTDEENQKTESKLFGKSLNWNYTDNKWVLGENYVLQGENWGNESGLLIRDKNDFQTKMTNEKITDDIVLTPQTLTNLITDKSTNVCASSDIGFYEIATTLDVNEINDYYDLHEQLGESYDEYGNKIVKAYNVILNQNELSAANDAKIYLEESFAEGYSVYLFKNNELTLQIATENKYNFNNENLVIVFVDTNPIFKFELSGFTAETQEETGFPKDVQFFVKKITNVGEIESILTNVNCEKVKEIYVVDLKQGENPYLNGQIEIWFNETLAGDFVVNKYDGNNLLVLTAEGGKYTIKEASIVIALTEKESEVEPSEPDNPENPNEDNQDNPEQNKPNDNKTQNLGLIIGLSIGGGLLFIAILIIIIGIIIRKKQKKTN